MSSFEDKHLVTIENGTTIDVSNKVEAIKALTDGIWSYHQQTVILNSNKDLILVEGKTDIDYIKTALAKLQPTNEEYQNLDFEFIPFGGTDGLQHFVDKFTPKDGQTIIALLDRDGAGKASLKKILNVPQIDSSFTYTAHNKIFIALIPKRDEFLGGENFVIEDYFKIEKLKEYFMKKTLSFESIPKKDTIKVPLSADCIDFAIDDFQGFKKLFNLIIEIKNPPTVI
jgi:5S rRNA maturation endonuclease (ribonuclease M5)